MTRSSQTFGQATPGRRPRACADPERSRKGDLALGLTALLLAGSLALHLSRTAGALAPKVLAQSATCGNGFVDDGEECEGGTKQEGGRIYRCVGCLWIQQTDDPTPDQATSVCCISNGQFANCVLLNPSECVTGANRTEAVAFSGLTAMSQCLAAVNGSGRKSCTAVASSSRSSSSAPVTRCGDNVIQKPNSDGVNEECDWGTGNSDTLPDTCRKNCTLAHCGDRVKDVDEACDNTDPGQVDDFSFRWGRHPACNSDCTPKVEENPLYMMFTANPIRESPLYMILPIDWQSIFFPFSNLAF